MLTNLADILRDAGLTVHEGAGWQTRGYLGRSLDAVHGIIVHHTAENRSTQPAVMARMLSVGRQGLPGPLCHLYLDRRGEWWTIAAGWANHAGAGGFRNLGGNRDTIGVEAANDGLGEPWLDRQMDSWVRGVAAVADAYSVPTDLIIAHREWTPRKPDPKNVNMGVFRARVEATRGAMPDPARGYRSPDRTFQRWSAATASSSSRRGTSSGSTTGPGSTRRSDERPPTAGRAGDGGPCRGCGDTR